MCTAAKLMRKCLIKIYARNSKAHIGSVMRWDFTGTWKWRELHTLTANMFKELGKTFHYKI